MSSFIVIGGDRRMLHTAESLGGVWCCGLPISNGRFDYAVLPPQKSPDGVDIYCPLSDNPAPYEILEEKVAGGGTVFTGNICKTLEDICEKNQLKLVNYLEREELAVRNAVLTVEGTVAIITDELECSVFGIEILITGFGRIGKILAKYLSCMGAKVSVACRKAGDREWAKIYGCKAVDITCSESFGNAVSKADVILNTVPSAVFGECEKNAIKEGTVYIELASQNGISGNPPENVKIINAGGLPGKTAPVTAGKIISDTILNIISEERGI